jgi:hypothetical protein
VLRIFGCKEKKVTALVKNACREASQLLLLTKYEYYESDQIRSVRWMGPVAWIGGDEGIQGFSWVTCSKKAAWKAWPLTGM